MYLIKYDKQAVKDIKNLKSAHLDGKAKALIEILRNNKIAQNRVIQIILS